MATGLRAPRLSVIICTHQMHREAPRTVLSATAPYQEDVGLADYELIVLDNGSDPPLSISPLPMGTSVVRVPSPHPSPVFAMNWAAREIARGDHLLFAIDGARIFSRRLYAETLLAHEACPDAFVFTLAWHLGPGQQKDTVPLGYDQAAEDGLLKQANWPAEPDALFEISSFASSSTGGFFHGIVESNAFSISRKMFDSFGGYDERFILAGGGLSNLEIFARYVTRPGARNVCLLSEGTFHQVHKTPEQIRAGEFARLEAEYRAIFGRPYVRPEYRTLYAGLPHRRVAPFVERSMRRLHQKRPR